MKGFIVKRNACPDLQMSSSGGRKNGIKHGADKSQENDLPKWPFI